MADLSSLLYSDGVMYRSRELARLGEPTLGNWSLKNPRPS